jgi:hypothetical protein
MSEQESPKSKAGIYFSFLIKLGLICLSPLFFWVACGRVIGLDDAFYSVEREAAARKISEHIKIPIETLDNTHYAHYAKGFMPADPNMHYRFEVNSQVLASFLKNNKFKKTEAKNNCIASSSYRPIGDWWKPAEIQSKTCFRWNRNSTDYSMKFDDIGSGKVKVYIFGYNN